MDSMQFLNFMARFGHLIFGVTWIGILYYFNFIQGGYFKKASPEALKDAKAHLAPEALWWFRWGAMFTFITGLILLAGLEMSALTNTYIVAGAVMGSLMFLNVWLVIWPNQQVALGMKEGDGPASGAKALLASRTNVLFSGPMAFFMLAGPHFGGSYSTALSSPLVSTTGLWVALAIIAALEVNALVGKQSVMTTVRGVITSSLVLTVILASVLFYVKSLDQSL